MSLIKRRSSSESRKETTIAAKGMDKSESIKFHIGGGGGFGIDQEHETTTRSQDYLHKLVQSHNLEFPPSSFTASTTSLAVGSGNSSSSMGRRKTSAELISEAKMFLGKVDSMPNGRQHITNVSGVRLVSTHRPITPREHGRVLYGKVSLAGRPPSAFSLRYLQKEAGKTWSTKKPLEPIKPNISSSSNSTASKNCNNLKSNNCKSPRHKLPALYMNGSEHKNKTNKSNADDIAHHHHQQPPPTTRNGDLLAQCSTATLIDYLKEHAGVRDCTDETVKYIEAILIELYNRVRKQDNHCKRGIILSGLYGLVECTVPKILIAVARVVLALRVTGSNLTGACKLIFKVARQEQNDSLFYNNDLLELLIDGLGSASPLDDPEACIYGYGSIRFLTTTSIGQDRNVDMNLRDMNKKCNLICDGMSEIYCKRNAPNDTAATSQQQQQQNEKYSLVQRLSRHGAIDLMVLHLQLLNEAGSTRQLTGPPMHSLFQLSAALRAFADVQRSSCGVVGVLEECRLIDTNWNETKNFLNLDLACPHLLRAYEVSIGEFEVQSNIVCTLSVLSEDKDCCLVLANYAARIGMLLGQFSDTPMNKILSILSRLGYVLGNILANYDSARLQYFNNDVAMEYLINVLDIYSKVPLTMKNNQGDTALDVLVKMVRVIANMSVNAEVGSSLGNTYTLGNVLLNLVNLYIAHATNPEDKDNLKFEMQDLIQATLGALHNLCFYQDKDTSTQLQLLSIEHKGSLRSVLSAVATSLCVALRASQTEEIKIELIRVIGNITRNGMAREHFCKAGGLYIIVQNLTRNPSNSYDLRSCAIGVLVNLLGDYDNRAPFLQLKGVELILLLLQGALEQEDWFLATIVCQAMWNLLIDANSTHNVNYNLTMLSDICSMLAQYLDDQHNETCRGDDTDATVWEDFTMVATDVLERIRKKFCNEPSLNESSVEGIANNTFHITAENDEVVIEEF